MIEAFLLDFVPPGGGVAVDVGANHGDWTRALAPRFGQVEAVEPNPTLAADLRAVASNVTVHVCGAWATAGSRTFTLYASDRNASAKAFAGGLAENDVWGTVDWPCAALDDLIRHRPVRFLKVDVEGAELEALAGAYDILWHDRPHVLVEVHGAENGVGVAALLRHLGYALQEIRNPLIDPASPLWAVNYWIDGRPL